MLLWRELAERLAKQITSPADHAAARSQRHGGEDPCRLAPKRGGLLLGLRRSPPGHRNRRDTQRTGSPVTRSERRAGPRNENTCQVSPESPYRSAGVPNEMSSR